MKRSLLLVIVIVFLSACDSKKNWTKATVVNDCLRDFTKRNEKEKRYTTLEIAQLCDCVGTKLTTNYKSKSEADKDEEGSMKIGRDCASEMMFSK